LNAQKERFSLLLRPEERDVLKLLSTETDRSQGATVRLLIREEARRRGVWPEPVVARRVVDAARK